MSKPIQKFARGQVWYVKDEEGDNGNFNGSVIGKTRPYLIISNNHNNLITDLVTVVPLTTSDSHFTTNSRVIGIYKLDSDVNGRKHYILCNQIKTINNTELIEFYGQLDKYCLKEVSDLINKTLCLSEKYEELFDNSYIGTPVIHKDDEDFHDLLEKISVRVDDEEFVALLEKISVSIDDFKKNTGKGVTTAVHDEFLRRVGISFKDRDKNLDLLRLANFVKSRTGQPTMTMDALMDWISKNYTEYTLQKPLIRGKEDKKATFWILTKKEDDCVDSKYSAAAFNNQQESNNDEKIQSSIEDYVVLHPIEEKPTEPNINVDLVDNDYVPRFTFNSKYAYELQDEIRSLDNVWSLRLYKLAKIDMGLLSSKEICRKYAIQKSNISNFKRKVSKENVSILVNKKGLA